MEHLWRRHVHEPNQAQEAKAAYRDGPLQFIHTHVQN